MPHGYTAMLLLSYGNLFIYLSLASKAIYSGSNFRFCLCSFLYKMLYIYDARETIEPNFTKVEVM